MHFKKVTKICPHRLSIFGTTSWESGYLELAPRGLPLTPSMWLPRGLIQLWQIVSCLRWAIALMSLAVITNKANTLVPGELHEGTNEIAHFSFH